MGGAPYIAAPGFVRSISSPPVIACDAPGLARSIRLRPVIGSTPWPVLSLRMCICVMMLPAASRYGSPPPPPIYGLACAMFASSGPALVAAPTSGRTRHAPSCS